MDSQRLEELNSFAVDFLKKLIETPSLSREESQTADQFTDFFSQKNIPFERIENNVFAKNKNFDAALPTILLNSHHDTVKPNISYTKDPFKAQIADGKLFGLGSNDAGGPLVSLLATFLYFYEKENLAFNLVFAASAEEEVSGVNGMELLVKHLPK